MKTRLPSTRSHFEIQINLSENNLLRWPDPVRNPVRNPRLSGADLRGYQTGTYRDRFLFAAQAEWRQRLSPRWGAVAFAGVGTVAPDFGRWGETLPSAGVGLRWVAAPKNNLSVRVDIAWGRGDNEFYVSIGEAF